MPSPYLSKSTAVLAALFLSLALVGCSSSENGEEAGESPAAQDETSQTPAEPQETAGAGGQDLIGDTAEMKRQRAIRVRNLLDKADAAANAGDHEQAKRLYREALDRAGRAATRPQRVSCSRDPERRPPGCGP